MAEWVAHRGWMARYPENTLAAVMAAINAGGEFVEIDIQLSRDGVPVLLHDATLKRTTGLPGSVFDYSVDALALLEGCDIARLSEVVAAVGKQPEVTLFVEVKDESVAHFGLEKTVEAVIHAIGEGIGQCVVIAFDERVLTYARQQAAIAIGWILEAFDAEAHCTAEALQPEYLICNHKKLAGQPPWPGTWQWMLYEINDRKTAIDFAEQGVALIETADIGGMLAAGEEVSGRE